MVPAVSADTSRAVTPKWEQMFYLYKEVMRGLLCVGHVCGQSWHVVCRNAIAQCSWLSRSYEAACVLFHAAALYIAITRHGLDVCCSHLRAVLTVHIRLPATSTNWGPSSGRGCMPKTRAVMRLLSLARPQHPQLWPLLPRPRCCSLPSRVYLMKRHQ